jgi:hypothetical protein
MDDAIDAERWRPEAFMDDAIDASRWLAPRGIHG